GITNNGGDGGVVIYDDCGGGRVDDDGEKESFGRGVMREDESLRGGSGGVIRDDEGGGGGETHGVEEVEDDLCPVSLAQLARDITFYMQGSGFEPRTPHLFTLRVKFLATRLPDKKNR
ncbi:hypothetical protein A2U01_0043012, partial [Trifolium medium]|nr:hypothetical protein [Trifolium medium]